MDLGLQDRVYLVTGGTRGLGRAAAEVLVLDANPQLAGPDLIFDLEVVDITSPSRIIMP